MRLAVNYAGEATLYSARYNPKSTENLKKGNRKVAGRWGAGAAKKFRGRTFFLFEHGKYSNYSFILTYRNQPTNIRTKRDINAFISYLKRQGTYGFAYSLEKTKKGVYHYHFVANMKRLTKRKGVGGKQSLNNAWARIRGDYATNAVRAIQLISDDFKGREALAFYIGKMCEYASKHNYEIEKLSKENAKNNVQFAFDDNIRLWSTSQNLVGKEKFVLEMTENYNLMYLAKKKATTYETITLDCGYYFDKLFFNRENVAFFFEEYQIQQQLQRLRKEKARKLEEKRKRSKQIKLLTKGQLVCKIY